MYLAPLQPCKQLNTQERKAAEGEDFWEEEVFLPPSSRRQKTEAKTCGFRFFLHRNQQAPGAGIRMSVTMTKTEGVTVLTLTSDPQSALPPICQLFKSLCYSPMCCSVSQHLKKIQGTSQSALGTIQIMIGLLNIGIGVILVIAGSGSWELCDSWFPFWLGPLFMLFGVMNILSEKRPSPCLIILNVFLSIAGVAFAITAIVLYSIHLEYIWFWWECPRDDYFEYRRDSMPTPSPEEIMLRQKCRESQKLLTRFVRSVAAVAVVLAAVELCVAISSAVLGMKTLCCSKKSEKSPDELETYKPLLEEVTSNPTA